MIVISIAGELYCKSCHDKNNSKSNGLLDPVIAPNNKDGKVVGLECETCRDYVMFERDKK